MQRNAHYLSGIDADTDGIARSLRRLADGIESHDVNIESISTHVHSDVDDADEFGVSLTYVASADYADVTTMLQYATRGYLRFVDQYIAPILQGDKSTTLRYRLNREFEPGDSIDLIDEDGDTFAKATVEATFRLPISQVVRMGIGHYGDHTVDFVVERLRELYHAERDEIDKDTPVTVVSFDDPEPVEAYPTEQYTQEYDHE